MQNKLICLCITNFNKEKYIERAIRSCESQIQQNFNIETILVNDGSKNFKLKELKKEYPDIKFISYKKNRGVSYASNKALFYTNAEYFMRVDADDYLSLKACLILISFMENNNYPFVYGDITKIDNKKNHEVIKRDKVNNLLEHGAGVLFRTKILKKLGGYNTKIKNCEDYDLIARIINVYGTGLYLPINYYRYYKTPSSHLSNKKKRNRILSEMKKKYEKFISKD